MDTPVTYVIIAVTIVISLLGFNNRELFERLKHHPYSEVRNKEWHRLISSGFLHGSYIHLGINMFVLYEFGRYVEGYYYQLFGPIAGMLLFLAMYLLTIIAGDIPTLIRKKNNPQFASIGASGAVSGILFIFVLLDPWNKLLLYGIIPVYAIIGAVLYLVYSSWASKNSKDMIDHDAHFYGGLFGMLFTVILSPMTLQIFWAGLIGDFPF